MDMKIYDISQEVFSCVVFPGDPKPESEQVMSIRKGDMVNLTKLTMCAHNGTHVDAPYHFLDAGKKVDEMDLERLIGYAFVADHNGVVTAEDAREKNNRVALTAAVNTVLGRALKLICLQTPEKI